MVRKVKLRCQQLVNKIINFVVSTFTVVIKLDMSHSRSFENQKGSRSGNWAPSTTDEENREMTERGVATITTPNNNTSLQGDGIRKVVFADEVGRPLEQEIHLNRLQLFEDSTSQPLLSLKLLGPQPVSLSDFDDSLSKMRVRLENVHQDKSTLLISVLAVATARSKSLAVRITWDNWQTYDDVAGSENGQMKTRGGTYDRFVVRIPVPTKTVPSDLSTKSLDEEPDPRNESGVQFAVHYDTEEQGSCWDNNYDSNYKMKWIYNY